MVETEHDTKEPHCSELVCWAAQLCCVVQVNTLEQDECEELLHRGSSVHKTRTPFPPPLDEKVTQTMHTQLFCCCSDNRCQVCPSDAQVRDGCREEGEGELTCVPSSLGALMDHIWALTVTTSNQIKSNLHLTKSLIFTLVFNSKITKIRACF